MTIPDGPTNESSFVRSDAERTYADAIKQLPRLICIAALKALAAGRE